MARSFFSFFPFVLCVNTALIPTPLISRDNPSSVSPVLAFPSCAIPCIEQAVVSVTSCGVQNLECQCDPQNSALIQEEATSCVVSSCGFQQAIQVLNDAIAQCSSALASAVPTSASSSEVQSAAPVSAPVGTSVTPSSVPTASPIDSSSFSVTSFSAVGSAVPSTVPSSVPNNLPNATFVIPACAVGCIQNSIRFTSCTLTDLTCQCDPQNADIIQSATVNCVTSNCGDDGDRIAIDVQRSQAADCAALSPHVITGSVTANGPTQISLTGSPTGIFTTIYPCGPPYYAYPSGLSPTDPFGSLPTPHSIPSNPGSVASSTDASVDPSESSGQTPTDPSSPVTSDGSFPSVGLSNSGTPVGPTSSKPSDGLSTSSGLSSPTDTIIPSSPITSDGPLSPAGSSIPTDPPGSAASSTYPVDPPSPSSTIPPSGGNGNGGGPSYGYGYGGYYPSSTPTGGDPSDPSSSITVSSSVTGPVSSLSSSTGPPDTSGGDSSSPSSSGTRSSLPSASGGDDSFPGTTGAEPSLPTTSSGSENTSISSSDPSSPSTSSSTSPSGTNDPPPPPPGYYGYGPVPAPASFTSPSTPTIPSSTPSEPLQSSSPFRLTLLPSNYSLLTYIMRVYFGFSSTSPYITSKGVTTNDRTSACTFTISQPGGLLSCSDSVSIAGEVGYFGDEFASVWGWGYTVLSTESKLVDLREKDLNGSLVVDTTSEYPYGSLLKLVNRDFIGNDNQARFCTQTTPSTFSGEIQTDTFIEGSPVRAYINGTQTLPTDCKEVKLVIEWIDNDGIGDTPGYA
ncbi:hypothetical protein MFRU_013g02510 [Monilinia fructicola]|uniref:CFEM domain-containing protein n=1 Tax=Monilinia fructicola TaxID=38448 RepID=A0A5M9JA61_MONFR|nr:hypothetical protein EYC84_011639 [Monilinia fructicola]KAG4030235.1 hypothetical protein MFRU_013g02510 [Monilinia fructicola]